MSVSALVENGKLVTSTSQSSLAAEAKGASSVNKDDFLQLLVAQMKFQDPLEPTENTEWVTQYAQFTQVEEMQNMASSMGLQRASALVGQTVIMEVPEPNGNLTTVQGNVDYVTFENNKAFLSIEGELYSIDNLSKVVDKTYLDAVKNVVNLESIIDKLTPLAELSIKDKEAVEEAVKLFDNLSDYELQFVEDDYKDKLLKYVEAMKKIINGDEQKEEADEETDSEEQNGEI